MYADATFSIHPTLSLPHCVHKSILYICVSIPSLRFIDIIFLDSIYMANILCLSLSDLFTLYNSRLICLTRTDLNLFFLWPSNIPPCIIPHLPYSFICQWTSRLFPCPGYRKQCCCEHWGPCVVFDYDFLRVYAQ